VPEEQSVFLVSINYTNQEYRLQLEKLTLQIEDANTIIVLPCLWWLALCKKFHEHPFSRKLDKVVPPSK